MEYEIKEQLAQEVEHDWDVKWNELRAHYPEYNEVVNDYGNGLEWDGNPHYSDRDINGFVFDEFKEMLIDKYRVNYKLFDYADEYYDFESANWYGYIKEGAVRTTNQIKNLLVECKFEALLR